MKKWVVSTQVYLSTVIYEDYQGEEYSPKFFEEWNIKHFFMTVITPKKICIISIELFRWYISAIYFAFWTVWGLSLQGLNITILWYQDFFRWLKCDTNGSIIQSLTWWFSSLIGERNSVYIKTTSTCCNEMWKNTFQSWIQPKKGLDPFATIFQVETFTFSAFKCKCLSSPCLSDGVLNVACSEKLFHNF